MALPPLLSIIIPTRNEAAVLAATLTHLQTNTGQGVRYEIIVCDGGSTDATVAVALAQQVRVVQAPTPGRAAQLNLGAQYASGKILYFLHADTLPPPGFGLLIQRYYEQGFAGGCFWLTFDIRHWILQTSSWASHFNMPNFQFGDQSLFVAKSLFEQLGRFNETLLLMEDVEMVTRIKRAAPFALIPHSVVTSARKYVAHGVVRTELTHLLVHTLYLLGTRQRTLARVYKKLLAK
jgi:rSAM/selenodomain-associated transferase 2